MSKTTEALAREAGMCVELFNMGGASIIYTGTVDCPHAGVAREELERFEALVRADEREKLALSLSALHDRQTINNQNYPSWWHAGVDDAIEAIRSGGS